MKTLNLGDLYRSSSTVIKLRLLQYSSILIKSRNNNVNHVRYNTVQYSPVSPTTPNSCLFYVLYSTCVRISSSCPSTRTLVIASSSEHLTSYVAAGVGCSSTRNKQGDAQFEYKYRNSM
jgi:hypothetical protein